MAEESPTIIANGAAAGASVAAVAMGCHAALSPRPGWRLRERLGGLRAGDAVLAVDHEERHAVDAVAPRLRLIGAHGGEVRARLERLARGIASRPTSAASATSSSIAAEVAALGEVRAT